MFTPVLLRVALGALACIAFSACSQSSPNNAGAQSPSPSTGSFVHVRGTIIAAKPSAITVKTQSGASVSVAVLPLTGVSGVVPGTISDIRAGTFIGTANVASGGGRRALEVVVFPESMRGTGEGNYPWDLPAKGGSAMTNGTVARSSMMTNGTVGRASTSGPLTVTINYNGGSTRVTILPSTPIVRIAPANRTMLAPGARVFVIAKQDNGHLAASRVIVGEHGTVPPM